MSSTEEKKAKYCRDRRGGTTLEHYPVALHWDYICFNEIVFERSGAQRHNGQVAHFSMEYTLCTSLFCGPQTAAHHDHCSGSLSRATCVVRCERPRAFGPVLAGHTPPSLLRGPRPRSGRRLIVDALPATVRYSTRMRGA